MRPPAMLTRIDSFFDWLAVPAPQRESAECRAAEAADAACGMTHLEDYRALAAVVLHAKPRRILEIGTYLGVTSDFFLQLQPECEVVSIAHTNARWNLFARRFNNSELSRGQIGSRVAASRCGRFHQLYGDSHELEAQRLVDRFGPFSMVFIDGDHSLAGVRQDTALARKILDASGVICWHDANPKPKYMEVRRFLEDELPLSAIATRDAYVGGVACWSDAIAQRLTAGALRATG